jgi:glycyl-tRNA synthetase beta chain
MGELLLELLSEEIPARMQRRAIDDLVGLIHDRLAAAEIPAASLRGYVTPRRLTVIANGIPERQPNRREERRGPRVGAPPQTVEGFLRAAGLASLEECEVRDTGRGEFYFAVLHRPGRAAAEVLPELLRAAIGDLPWPKSMRYPAASLRWVRPLISAICLFDGAVLPLPLDQVPVGRTTRGHRFLSAGETAVENAADYLERLEAGYVILDHDRRRELIAADLDRLAAAEGLIVKPDPALLEEVAGLVEFPVVLMGRIEGEFVRPWPEGLPPEVLVTVMRTHQKYFSCLKPGGSPAPRFLFVANNLTPDHGKTIIAGNERVLRARLADARFFWEQDRKIRLEDRVEALKQRVFYDKLGTVFDKTERIQRLSAALTQQLYPAQPEMGVLAQRAARLCKADLSTGMVGEFPELQGVMGRYYALHDDEDSCVADAIADHYKPLGPSDTCPTAPVSMVVALADKIDTLTAFFTIDERPSGSRDPFALRRAALGLIRIILENKLRLALHRYFLVIQPIPPATLSSGSFAEELVTFVADRVKAHLRDQGVRHDLIAAAFSPLGSLNRVEDDVVRLLRRVAAIESFLRTEDGASLLTAYRRASNIVAIEERRDKCRYEPPDDPALLQQPEERALTRWLGEVDGLSRELLRQEQFEEAMAALARLRRPVDEFFDKVTVNTNNAKLRENRLRLLARIRAVMNQVADFSQIEG